MCQSRVDGGQRCDCDSSQARNHRRIKNKVANSDLLSIPSTQKPESVSIVPPVLTGKDNLREMLNQDMSSALSLQEKLSFTHFALANGAPGSWYDKERAITQLGQSIAEHVDETTGIDVEKVHRENLERDEKIKSLTQETEVLYKEIKKREKGLRMLYGAEHRARYEKEVSPLIQKIREANILCRELQIQRTQESLVRHQKRADAYREVLRSLRSFGGIVTNVGPKSDKKAVNLLNEALGDVPSDWIEDSNENSSLIRVASSQGRAHYAHAKIIPTRQHRPIVDVFPFDSALSEEQISAATKDNSNTTKYVLASLLSAEERIEYRIDESRDDYSQTYICSHYESLPDYSESEGFESKPSGRGWVKSISVENFTKGNPIWVRPVTSLQKVDSQRLSELTVTPRTSPLSPPGVSVAAHEFMHRAEVVRKNLALVESVFVSRRTTGEDGQRQELQNYQGKANELVRSDGFTDVYMGRDYGEDTPHHEIISCGVQALFHGNLGGLVGEDGYKKDTDTRNFVLGVLASM